jgi:mono/diheme cytochrome c family protein
METGRPVEDPALDYLEKAQWILPGPLGGHNWQAMSFDEGKGIMYIPAQEIPLAYAMSDEWKSTGSLKPVAHTWNLGIEMGRLPDISDQAGESPPNRGVLKAFDPLTGETIWAVEQSHHWNGGLLATKGGLVFQGDYQGAVNAYDADTGEKLWAFDAYISFLAPPISYQIDGTQYIAILAGSGGGDLFGGAVENMASLEYGNAGKLLVFKLGGKVNLVAPIPVDRSIPDVDLTGVSAKDIERGEHLYHKRCVMCHGFAAKSGGVVPDLRLLTPDRHARFEDVVLRGILASRGMASFADVLNEADVGRIQGYIKYRASEDKAEAEAESATIDVGPQAR